jgi:hypothetical protein
MEGKSNRKPYEEWEWRVDDLAMKRTEGIREVLKGLELHGDMCAWQVPQKIDRHVT